eukprot:5749179-Alexandrium_andersonii.AAC.1
MAGLVSRNYRSSRRRLTWGAGPESARPSPKPSGGAPSAPMDRTTWAAPATRRPGATFALVGWPLGAQMNCLRHRHSRPRPR